MEKLSISETNVSPKIVFDPQTGLLEITGCSIVDDPLTFYQPVLTWITQYVREKNVRTHVMCKFTYFNTASAKVILDILTSLHSLKQLSVTWHYREDDDDTKQAGEEFFELVNIPFEFKTY